MSQTDYYANIDFDRAERCGFPEVIFGEGKTPAQTAGIAAKLVLAHDVVLVTRATEEHANALRAVGFDPVFVESCGIVYIDRRPEPLCISGKTCEEILTDGAKQEAQDEQAGQETQGEQAGQEAQDKQAQGIQPQGNVVVCCAGTSDLPVAEEAVITARIMGSHTTLLADVGVAGVHRVLGKQELLQSARVIVAVAGMEGALPSLVAGLVDVPVIAVPTSVGYGASFGGIAALLGMLTSCAGGVSVVNINNGFGAGQIAHRINAPSWLGTSR